MKLPSEIRICIYEYSFDWPDMKPRVDALKEALKTEDINIWSKLLDQKFITPNILLLNRQITTEARAVILKKTLFIDLAIPRMRWFDTPAMPNGVLCFIPESALRAAPRVWLRVGPQEKSEKLFWSNCQHTLGELVTIWWTKQNLESIVMEAVSTTDSMTCSYDVSGNPIDCHLKTLIVRQPALFRTLTLDWAFSVLG